MLSYVRSRWNSFRNHLHEMVVRRARRPRRAYRPECEHLETRRVLSCTLVTLNATNGYLTVNGTTDADIVSVSESQGVITVSLAPTTTCTFATSQVSKLQFFGNQGDDQYQNLTAIDSFLYGGGGNDTLTGGSGIDWIEGQDGNDTVRGNGGNDVLKGHDGADQLFGDDGNDYFEGGIGDDTIYGGDGGDTILGGVGNDLIYAGLGNDREVYGDDGDDTIHGEEGNDYLRGMAGNDILRGGIGDDTLVGLVGNDQLFGEDGQDILYGGDDHDSLYGDAGNDTLYGESGDDWLWGGDGDESELKGALGNDFIFGEAGNDILNGDEGNDLLLGGDGIDNLVARDDRDILGGGNGVDTLLGMNGEDILMSGPTIFGDSAASINISAWMSIHTAWNDTTKSYAERVAAMSDAANPLALIPGTSVLDDYVSEALTGAAGLDWFLLVGGNGVQTPESNPQATLGTLDSYDRQPDETIHTNAVNNVFYPSLVTDGTADNTLAIMSLLYFTDVVTLPAGTLRVNMTSDNAPIQLSAGKTLRGQADGTTNLAFHAASTLQKPRGIRVFSDSMLEDLNISQTGYGTAGASSIVVHGEGAQNVTVRKVIVTGPAVAGPPASPRVASTLFLRDTNNAVIEDSEFSGARDHFGAELLNVTNSLIVRSKFHDNGWDGLKVQSTTSTPLNLEVRDSSFYRNGSPAANGNGMDMYGRGIVVRNSVAYANHGAGFQVKPSGVNYAADIAFIDCESYGQVVTVGYGQSGFAIWNADFVGAISNIRFERCFSHNNTGSGFWFGDDVRTVTVVDCVANDNAGYALVGYLPASQVAITNLTGTGNPLGLAHFQPFADSDINHDNRTDGSDLAIAYSQWSQSLVGADLNGDSVVDGADLAIVYGLWTGDI